MKTQKILLIFILLGISYFAYDTYRRQNFDIEKYIISKKFNGDPEKHAAAKNSGSIKYCDNYVMIHGGVPQSSLHTISYYRVSDGRLYSVSGQLCFGFNKWQITIFGRDIFTGYEKPLTCETPPRDMICSENCPSLKCAIRYGEVNSAKKLIEQGDNPNAITDYMGGQSLLMQAIQKRNPEIAKILVEHGADVNYKNKNGMTALHKLSTSVHKDQMFRDLFSLLMKSNANINAQNQLGYTPLHLLMNWTRSETDHVKIFEDYLKNGADPNIQNNKGDTVLNLYLKMHRPDKRLIKMIIDFGVNPNIKNADGKSASDIAQERSFKEIVKLLDNKT